MTWTRIESVWVMLSLIGALASAQNPAPTLASVWPPALAAGAGDHRLDVAGTGFVASTVVRWNGAALSTVVVSSTYVEAVVPAALTAVAGTASVQVWTPPPGGGATSSVTVQIVPCARPALVTTLPGVAIGDRFGQRVDFVGDVDGDGRDDLLVESIAGWSLWSVATGTQIPVPGVTLTGWTGDVNGDGRADLAADGGGTTIILSGMNLAGPPLLTFPGVGPVRGLGDVDADGAREFGIGGTNDLRVVSGATGAVLQTLNGLQPGDGFGADFDDAGDTNGDGSDDIIVGAPMANFSDGSVHVVSGADWSFMAGFGGAYQVGRLVRGIGDVDADGFADVAFSDGPELLVFSGGTWAFFAGPDVEAVARLGDTDADGYDDVGAGYPGGNQAFVFGGGATSIGFSWSEDISCAGTGDMFGVSVSAGDVDGDGIVDLAVGASQPAVYAPPGPGYVRVLRMPLARSASVGAACSALGPPYPGLSVDAPILGEVAVISLTASQYPSAPGLLGIAGTALDPPMVVGGGCTLRIDPFTSTLIPFVTSATGTWTLPVQIPFDPVFVGVPFHLQAGIDDPMATPTFALTSAWRAVAGW